ncbi:MAG: efflux RND transporter periplasmic adaptor subunit [Pseudobdellovibrionaceae bacterium]
MKILGLFFCFFVAAVSFSSFGYAEEFIVKSRKVYDPKPVFATVESVDVVAARARIGGTIISLHVKEGDSVTGGQEIAVIGDDKLALQVKTLDAQILGLAAQQERARADLNRVQALVGSGSVSRTEFDAAKAAESAASNELKARKTQREVIEQQMTEGKILAPSFGRVLNVPLTAGSVVMPGETIATIAAESYILRLRLPERHAQFLKKGDKVYLEGSEMGGRVTAEGEISLVYPEIDDGRVIADAVVSGIDNYYVGERVQVLVNTTERNAYMVPVRFISRRSGIDYVTVKTGDGEVYDFPVQRGRVDDQSKGESVEIISGVHDGDVLFLPQEK